jgi:hypothetical protein
MYVTQMFLPPKMYVTINRVLAVSNHFIELAASIIFSEVADSGLTVNDARNMDPSLLASTSTMVYLQQ